MTRVERIRPTSGQCPVLPRHYFFRLHPCSKKPYAKFVHPFANPFVVLVPPLAGFLCVASSPSPAQPLEKPFRWGAHKAHCIVQGRRSSFVGLRHFIFGRRENRHASAGLGCSFYQAAVFYISNTTDTSCLSFVLLITLYMLFLSDMSNHFITEPRKPQQRQLAMPYAIV